MAVLTGIGGPFAFDFLSPRIQLSPRMRGWSVADHFASTNGLRASILLEDLEVVSASVDDNVKGPLTLMFSDGTITYKIPYSLASLVGPGYNSQVVWRFLALLYGGSGSGTFRYYKESPKIT